MYERAYQNYLDGEYELTFAGCGSALIAFEKERSDSEVRVATRHDYR